MKKFIYKIQLLAKKENISYFCPSVAECNNPTRIPPSRVLKMLLFLPVPGCIKHNLPGPVDALTPAPGTFISTSIIP